MLSEQTFFSENGVMVTQARFVVPGQTFAMSGVTSVTARVSYPGKAKATKLIMWGFPCIILLLVGIPMVIGGIIWLVTANPLYTVYLTSSSGEAAAYSSPDEGFIQNVIAAITDSIVARG